MCQLAREFLGFSSSKPISHCLLLFPRIFPNSFHLVIDPCLCLSLPIAPCMPTPDLATTFCLQQSAPSLPSSPCTSPSALPSPFAVPSSVRIFSLSPPGNHFISLITRSSTFLFPCFSSFTVLDRFSHDPPSLFKLSRSLPILHHHRCPPRRYRPQLYQEQAGPFRMAYSHCRSVRLGCYPCWWHDAPSRISSLPPIQEPRCRRSTCSRPSHDLAR